MAYIKSIRKIYSDGRHNAFTDMEYFRGYYYVAFRNAGRHAVPEDYGDVLVIRSRDLESWELCARLSTGDDHDDRDPHLLDLGEELGVYFFSAFPKQPGQLLYEEASGGGHHVQACASFTSDGISWSAPQTVRDECAIWQIERFGGVCFASFGNKGAFAIGKSMGGRNWEEVATITFPTQQTVEAGIWITEDEKMHLIVRMSKNEEMAYLAESEPPYTDWKLTKLNYTVHCPVFRPVGDELWLAGKTITAQFPASVAIPPEPSPEKIASLARQDARLAKTPQDWHTAIWKLVGDHLEPILVLPSRGDCGYPGLVVEEDRVLMSFYSQHDVDEGPKPKPGECANEIYLAEIEL